MSFLSIKSLRARITDLEVENGALKEQLTKLELECATLQETLWDYARASKGVVTQESYHA